MCNGGAHRGNNLNLYPAHTFQLCCILCYVQSPTLQEMTLKVSSLFSNFFCSTTLDSQRLWVGRSPSLLPHFCTQDGEISPLIVIGRMSHLHGSFPGEKEECDWRDSWSLRAIGLGSLLSLLHSGFSAVPSSFSPERLLTGWERNSGEMEQKAHLVLGLVAFFCPVYPKCHWSASLSDPHAFLH